MLSRDRRLPFCRVNTGRDFRIVITHAALLGPSFGGLMFWIAAVQAYASFISGLCIAASTFRSNQPLSSGAHAVHRGATLGASNVNVTPFLLHCGVLAGWPMFHGC